MIKQFRRLLSGVTPSDSKSNRQATLMVERLVDRQMLAVFEVSNLADSGAGSLRQAIEDANALEGADEIVFVAGGNSGSIELTSGQLEITDALTISGPGAAALMVDQTTTNSRVIYVDTDQNVTISGLTITGGDIAGDGGGILFEGGGSLTLSSVIVTGNAAEDGGGISLYDGSLTIINSEITMNSATEDGGGIEFDGDRRGLRLTISGSTIDNNTSGEDGGGIAVYLDDDAEAPQISITDTSISGNTATEQGGGLYLNINDSHATVTLESVTIDENVAGGDGGGVYAAFDSSDASFSITNSSVSGNEASSGGGLYLYFEGARSSVTITNTTIDENIAASGGGGIFIDVDSFVTNFSLTITDSSISGNTAGSDGGGLYLYLGGAASTVIIENTTIDENEGSSGGGAYFKTYYYAGGTTILIKDSSFSGNTASSGGGGFYWYGYCSNVTFTVEGSTIDDNTASGGGGGIHIDLDDDSTFDNIFTLRDSSVSGNYSGDYGGGLYFYSAGYRTNLIIENTTIDGNEAVNGGGGIYVQWYDDYTEGSSIVVRDSSISGNTAGRYGGGLYLYLGGAGTSVAFTNTVVDNNTASYGGGGLWVDTDQPAFTFSFTGGSISGNAAESGYGGGLYLDVADAATITLSGVTISGNTASSGGGGVYFDGDESVSFTITNSVVSGNTAESGDGGGLYLDFSGYSGTLKISDTTIENNDADGDGGGLYVYADYEGFLMRIENSSISGNSATGDGGGLYLYTGDSAVITISNTQINNNTAGSDGGGIAADLDGAGTDLTIIDSSISGNEAGGNGGGLYLYAGADNVKVTIERTQVNNNTAGSSGGGIYYEDHGYEDSLFYVIDSEVTGNMALGGDGGGIHIDSDGDRDVRITRSTISDNSATGDGGGIWTRKADVVIVESTISENTASGKGGGIYFYDATNSNDPRLALIRSTVSGNSAGEQGGGVYFYTDESDTSFLVENTTISGNMATGDGGGLFFHMDNNALVFQINSSTITGNTSGGTGGGIYLYGDPVGVEVNINNTIIANNSDSSGANDLAGNGDSIVNATYSLFETDPGAILNGENIGNIIGQDPLLGALQDNGGPTFTHALLTNSPALNAGDPNFTGPPNTDQRGTGFARPFGAAIDIGAYEAQTGIEFVVAAPGVGGDTISVLNASDLTELYTLTPFPGFGGGMTVATGDVNGDGVDDIIAAAGPGGGPHVIVYDGSTQTVLYSFFAYDPSFTGGVFVAAGDIDGDGKADIVTGAGAGGGPHVQVFSGEDLSVIRSFFAYVTEFTGGVRVATGDVNGDSQLDIITGAGAGGGPHVQAFSGSDLSVLASFFAYDPAFSAGVFVASGDTNGDDMDEIITGAGAGGGPHVKVFEASGTELQSFFAYDPAFAGGVFVAGGDIDGDGKADIITGAGPGGGPHVRGFDGETLDELLNFFGLDPSFTGGVFVVGGDRQADATSGLLPLRVAGGPLDASAEILTYEQLDLVFAQAIAAWQEPSLASTPVTIRDLPGDLLGLGGETGVIIDIDAAGYGWALSEEELADGQRIDLLTVLAHELGHVLGLPDLDAIADDLMAAELEPGQRKLPRKN